MLLKFYDIWEQMGLIKKLERLKGVY